MIISYPFNFLYNLDLYTHTVKVESAEGAPKNEQIIIWLLVTQDTGLYMKVSQYAQPCSIKKRLCYPMHIS